MGVSEQTRAEHLAVPYLVYGYRLVTSLGGSIDQIPRDSFLGTVMFRIRILC